MKKLFSIILVIALMLTAMTTGVFATDTGDDPTSWKQYDDRWGSLKLGNSGTMSCWGCLVTSISIQMARAGVADDDFNPGVLRDELEAGGFISHANTIAADGNLSYGAAFSKSNSPDFYYAGSKDWTYTSFSNIRETISGLQSDGYYVIAQVKYGGHWVACGPVTTNDVTIFDPGYSVSSLKKYDGGIMGCVYFKATTSTENAKGSAAVQTENTSKVALSGATKPTVIKEGNVFYLKGTISAPADNQLKHVVVGVYDENGDWITGKCSMSVNSCSYDIAKEADVAVRFNILARGNYKYKVVAITENGIRETLLERDFTVK